MNASARASACPLAVVELDDIGANRAFLADIADSPRGISCVEMPCVTTGSGKESHKPNCVHIAATAAKRQPRRPPARRFATRAPVPRQVRTLSQPKGPRGPKMRRGRASQPVLRSGRVPRARHGTLLRDVQRSPLWSSNLREPLLADLESSRWSSRGSVRARGAYRLREKSNDGPFATRYGARRIVDKRVDEIATTPSRRRRLTCPRIPDMQGIPGIPHTLPLVANDHDPRDLKGRSCHPRCRPGSRRCSR
jgi:hypothetical protein